MDVSEWLECLNFSPDEFVSVCHKHCSTAEFKYSVLPPAAVPFYVESMSAEHDIWLGVNPVAGPPRSTGGRGKPEDVTRMSAVFCDLDVKPGGCADLGMAAAIVDELASALGEYPTMVVHSGHGLQPYWAIDPGDGELAADGHGALSPAEIEPYLLRFGRLVRAVANSQGAKVDSVFDLARILRCPGTRNFKGEAPVDVSAVPGTGAPMDLDTLAERLDEAGIADIPADASSPEDQDASDPASWKWAEQPCGYVAQMAREWMTEQVDARHPWALRCMTRLECARRNGCINRELYQGISEMVQQRLLNLLASGPDSRKPHRYEWRDICLYAERLASTKTPAGLASELGAHAHESLIDAAVKAGNVRTLPTGRNRAKGGSAASTAPGIATVTSLPKAAPANYTMTDDGNASRLVAEHAERLRYVPEHKVWLGWDGTVWQPHADDSPAVRAATAIARALPVIAGDKTALAWKKKSLSKQGIMNMVRLAQADAKMQVAQQDLDTHPYELNTPEGIIDLRTGELLRHDPARWHTKITAVHYDPAAVAPLWEAFLRTTFQNQDELIHYVQQLAGYSCIGEVTHHILPFLYGEVGQNGKSVLLRTFQDCLGSYAATLPIAVLVSGRNSHTEDISGLAGVRLVVCSEIGHDTQWDEEKIKTLTGGDNITARHLYGKNFSFKPSHTIMIAANDAPRVESGGKSFFRRLKLVPFEHSIPDDKVDELLPHKLIEHEGPAILAWMVRGAVEVHSNGLPVPQLVQEATTEYQESEDLVLQWMNAMCDRNVDIDDGEFADRLYQSYRMWCQANRHYPIMNSTLFGRALTKHDIAFRRTNAGRRRALRLLHEQPTLPPYMRGPGL